MHVVNQFIDGKEHISKSERFGDIYNPASGEKIKKVSFSNEDDVELAIKCAVKAGEKWSATPPLTRSRVLFKFRDLISTSSAAVPLQIAIEYLFPIDREKFFSNFLPLPTACKKV